MNRDWLVGRLIPVVPATPPLGPPTKYDPARDVFKLGPSPRPLHVFGEQSKQASHDFPCGWDERDALV